MQHLRLAVQPRFSHRHSSVCHAMSSAALLIPGLLFFAGGIGLLLVLGVGGTRIDLAAFGIGVIYATLFTVAYVVRDQEHLGSAEDSVGVNPGAGIDRPTRTRKSMAGSHRLDP